MDLQWWGCYNCRMLSGKRWKIPYYLGLTRVPTAPLYVNVEPAATCNLRCGWCSSRHRGDQKARMDMGLFKNIVVDAKSAGVINISLWLSGEPLMHPQLAEMVAFIEENGLVSGVHTNATMLTERHARDLLDAGLSQLSISFDGIDRESYEQMREGANFEKTIANIRGFLNLKARRGNHKPHTIIQTIVPFQSEMQDDNGWIQYPEAPSQVRQLFADLPVEEFRVVLPHNWAGEVQGDGLRPPGRAYHPCQHLWMGLSVAWDGRVHGCCTDLNGVLIRGDLKQGDSIQEIWNDRASRRMRWLHRKGRYREIPLCRDCTQVWENEHPLRTELRRLPLLRSAIAARRRLKGSQ
ncbi:MAG: radical SAM protein [Chloroflexi bacterium]|nr:radical SAM protein [Chloroflexota bacterium]